MSLERETRLTAGAAAPFEVAVAVGRRRDLIRLPRQSATGLVPQSRRCAGCGSAGEHEQQSGVKAHCKASSAGGPAGSRQGPACPEPSQICRRRPANVTSTPQNVAPSQVGSAPRPFLFPRSRSQLSERMDGTADDQSRHLRSRRPAPLARKLASTRSDEIEAESRVSIF